MKKEAGKTKSAYFELIFVLLLLLIYSVFAVFLVGLGAEIYGSITDRMDEHYEARTPLSYIATKVRQADTSGGVQVLSNDYIENAVVLTEQNDIGDFETWIYFHDGALYEYYLEKGMIFDPADGMKVLETGEIRFEKIGRMIKAVAVSEEGSDNVIFVSLRADI